jgi:integration host factor subunit beta
MTKAELVEKLANKNKLSRKQAIDVINAITQSISDSLAEGNKVEIRGFGSFRIRDRKARTAYNPSSRVEVKVPAKKVPFFKPGSDLRKLVDDAG